MNTNAFSPGAKAQRILVTGATGFIGTPLVKQLLAAGHALTVWSRKPARAQRLFNGKARCVAHLDALEPATVFDAIINLAGAPVVGPRWSARRQAILLASRVGTTTALAQWLSMAAQPPAVWVQASAIGFYGVRPAHEVLTETSTPGQGFMGQLCQHWEAAAQAAVPAATRLVVLRLGVVLGPGGALPPLLLPIRLGLGGRMGSGKQIMSWIHRDDVLQLIAQCLSDAHMQGCYNAVAPGALSQQAFAATAAKLLQRPLWLHLPAAPIRVLAGEMAQIFVDGQNVRPARLQAQGFPFTYPLLQAALQNLLAHTAAPANR